MPQLAVTKVNCLWLQTKKETCRTFIKGLWELKMLGPLKLPLFQTPLSEQFRMCASWSTGILKPHGTMTQEFMMPTILWGSVMSQVLQEAPGSRINKDNKHFYHNPDHSLTSGTLHSHVFSTNFVFWMWSHYFHLSTGRDYFLHCCYSDREKKKLAHAESNGDV